MLKFEYKDATPEKKNEMISEIASNYKIKNKNELIQALAHAQAVLSCTQDEFANNVGITARTIRVYKKEFEELYKEAYEKYLPEPELVDVEIEVEEDAMESVYTNLLARLSSPKTATKDLATILTYFGISGAELRQYAQVRNATLRGWSRDNMKSLVPNEDTANLAKAVIAESDYLYRGTPSSQGNTERALEMDLDDNLVRLELQTFGLLFVGLFNGKVSDQFINHAETLRMLKLASSEKDTDTKQSIKEFEKMDGKPPKLKPINPRMEKDLMDIFGDEQGKEMFNKLSDTKDQVTKKTAIKLPRYEEIKEDYDKCLKIFPAIDEMPFKLFLEKLDADTDQAYKEKYQEYLANEDN
ncbi:hypothetical protein [Priestia megaterium]|uniref:hypothetical protein n=1 Tax=Priestia megaterium TaxID=1404 RepID=UPI00234F8D39|nr:hypothetical protein [Priestia megaterium]MDC7781850.1 hypothetical protein [Priestia megaterium]